MHILGLFIFLLLIAGAAFFEGEYGHAIILIGVAFALQQSSHAYREARITRATLQMMLRAQDEKNAEKKDEE